MAKTKRLLSLLLAVAMVLSLMPAIAFAAETETENETEIENETTSDTVVNAPPTNIDWEYVDEWPTEPGNYRLISDVVVNTTMKPLEECTVNIDLNGHRVTASTARLFTLNQGYDIYVYIYDSVGTARVEISLAGGGGVAAIGGESGTKELNIFGGTFDASGVSAGTDNGLIARADGAKCKCDINLYGGVFIGGIQDTGTGETFYTKGANANLNVALKGDGKVGENAYGINGIYPETHIACECGSKTGDHLPGCSRVKHNDWSAWTDAATLPTAKGYYYLTKDVSISSTQTVVNGASVYLDLNGQTVNSSIITYNLAQAYDANLTISDSKGEGKVIIESTVTGGAGLAAVGNETGNKVLTIYGGTFDARAVETSNDGGLVRVSASTGTVNVHGGTIIGAKGADVGGAIYINKAGTLNMTGGTIKGGSANNGGNVAVQNNGTFTMSGGEIIGGNATASNGRGGNVFTDTATFHISGNAKIDKGNAINVSVSNNVYIGNNVNFNVSFEGDGHIGGNRYGVNGENGIGTNIGSNVFKAITHIACECGSKTGKHLEGCKGVKHTNWTAWTDTATLPTTSDHFYLTDDVSIGSPQVVANGASVYLDLNGHTVTSSKITYNLNQKNDTNLTISDSEGKGGFIIESAVTGGAGLAAISVDTGRKVLTIYGGTFDASAVETDKKGALIRSTASNNEINIHGGTLIGGKTSDVGGTIYTMGDLKMTGEAKICGGSAKYGGNIYTDGGVITMKDGEISGGTATLGGNVYLTKGSVLDMSGGTISDGNADKQGGSIYSEGILNISGGEISGGTAGANGAGAGGNIYAHGGELTITGGSICEGYAGNTGGNIQATDTTVFTMSGGMISDGSADNSGGNLYLFCNTSEISGGELVGGTAGTTGGNIHIQGGGVTLSGGKIHGGNAGSEDTGKGGNIYTLSKLTLRGDVMIYNGSAGVTESNNICLQGSAELNSNDFVGTVCQKDVNSNGIYMDDSETEKDIDNDHFFVASKEGGIHCVCGAGSCVSKLNTRFGENFSLLFAYDPATVEGSTPVVTVNGETIERSFENTEIEGKTYRVLEVTGLTAKQMSDRVQITIGETTESFSLKTYATSVLEASEDISYKTLIVDMLNYGAEAQKKFGYNTGSLANNQLTDEQKALASELQPVINNRSMEIGDVFGGSNLRFNDEINLLFRFKIAADTFAKFTWKDYKGVERTKELTNKDYIYSGGYYIVELADELSFADARTDVTCTIYSNAGDPIVTVTDSIQANVARNTDSRALYEAFMKFADSAVAYIQ